MRYNENMAAQDGLSVIESECLFDTVERDIFKDDILEKYGIDTDSQYHPRLSGTKANFQNSVLNWLNEKSYLIPNEF